MSSAAMPDEGLLPGLGYLAAALTAALSKLAEEKFSLYGVAPVQYAILDTCSNGQVNTVMGLTKVIPMDQASISRHVPPWPRGGSFSGLASRRTGRWCCWR